MIRIGLPVPTVLRLRLRAQIAAERVARTAQSIRQGVLAVVRTDLILIRRLSLVRVRRSRVVARPAADPAALMPEFERQYQELVDLLCWSAKDGVHDRRDARYAELRAWFLVNYDPLRPALLPHLQIVQEDLVPAEPGEVAPRDAFESLFLSASVDALIHSDTVIFRIMRTRCAVDALRDELDSARS